MRSIPPRNLAVLHPGADAGGELSRGGRLCLWPGVSDGGDNGAGPDFAATLRRDILPLQDTGLDNLGPRHAELRARYGAIDHPAAREITDWLDGRFRTTLEEVQTQ